MNPVVYTVGVSPTRITSAAASGAGSESSRIGASTPASRNRTPSSARATASESAPGTEGCLAHRHVAVAVGIGLDHRTHREGATTSRMAATLNAIAARSISTQVGLTRRGPIPSRRPDLAVTVA
jgi:hypothetical protein